MARFPDRTHMRFALAVATICVLLHADVGNALATRQSAQRRTPTAADTALAVHVLNRTTFGAREVDLAGVLAVGVDAWLEEQLNADAVLDSAARHALSGCVLFTAPLETALTQMTTGRTFASMNPDAPRRAVILGEGVKVVSSDSISRLVDSPFSGLFAANAQLHACRLTRFEYSDRQLREVLTDFWQNHFSIDGARVPVRGAFVQYDRAVIHRNAMGRFRLLLRDVARSPAMLTYLDNAVNSADSTRRTLKPYRTPDPNGRRDRQLVRPGLNENYARELLELHTLGADGGYSQHDVTEVARAFTGWSHTGAVPGGDEVDQFFGAVYRDQPRTYLSFVFDPTRHDAEEKTVLGRTLAAGRGTDDGEDVLAMLAEHPATAYHVSRKLVVRFVSDNPPEALVRKAADTFLRTKGDIRETTRTILMSDEFRSPQFFGAKVKSPQEYVLSIRRALNAPVDSAGETVDLLIRLDQPPISRPSPDGWPETGGAWMTAGALHARLNIAMEVANDSLPSVPASGWRWWSVLAHAPFDAQVAGVLQHLLLGQASAATRTALASLRPASGGAESPAERERMLRQLIALALGSPDFQRR